MALDTGNGNILIERLLQCFYNGSLDFVLKPEDIQAMVWSQQEIFLNATVQSNRLVKYPVSTEFCRLFFKKLIGYLEVSQEIHDNMYLYLCSVMNNTSQKDNFSYRHYIIGNNLNNIVTIKETNKMVVNGTTGMRTWEAALMTSDWALCNKEIFKEKKILELGSGVGFTSIVVAKSCKIQSILLTDCHNDVLQTICENIKINFPKCYNIEEPLNTTLFRDQGKSLGVMMLDWNNIKDFPEDVAPDILIGADIIYDPSILVPLCNVMKMFFHRNKYLEVFIASVIRNEDTFNKFLSSLDEFNFKYEQILQKECVFINWDQNIKRCLLKINYTIAYIQCFLILPMRNRQSVVP